MAKKMKRYDGEEGSLVEFETKQGQNKAITDDVRERAMKAIAEGGQKDEAPAPKAVLKPETKAAMKEPAPVAVKTVSKEVTKPTPRSPGRMVMEESEYAMKPRLQSKGENLMKSAGIRTSFKSGGKVKSASARADGCAIRGKTRA